MSSMKSYKSLMAAVLALSASLALAQNRQSPIDFNEQDVIDRTNQAKITVTMSSSVNLSVVNTYNPAGVIPKEFATVKANVPQGNSVTVDGISYDLLQFHFHTPSEHTVEGKHAPMEVHFVCLKHGAALGDANSLLVVGAWIQSGEKANSEFGKIFSNLPAPTATVQVNNFNLASVFPSTKSTFRYLGSLTAPATGGNIIPTAQQQLDSNIFPEIVQWVVSDETVTFSKDQISAFKVLFPEEVGNSREVQELAERKATYSRKFD